MAEKPRILQDMTKPTYEQLLAEVERLKAERSGPQIAWAKGKEGEAVSITFPGKRGRYLEIEEIIWLFEHQEMVLERIKDLGKEGE